jgi:hypothetical protein
MISVISKAALIAYLVLLLLSVSGGVLSVPGGRVPIYALLGVLAAIPSLCDDRKLRLWVLPAIIVAMGLIVYDHQSGAEFQRKVVDRRVNAAQQMSATAPATLPRNP